ncbi:MAG: hypothetical protein Q4F30_11095 [Akkermansia sp.]|nr:hypothetical protein [Akkermansia sp.]
MHSISGNEQGYITSYRPPSTQCVNTFVAPLERASSYCKIDSSGNIAHSVFISAKNRVIECAALNPHAYSIFYEVASVILVATIYGGIKFPALNEQVGTAVNGRGTRTCRVACYDQAIKRAAIDLEIGALADSASCATGRNQALECSALDDNGTGTAYLASPSATAHRSTACISCVA